MAQREVILKAVAIDDLRPTQITLGMREVAEKRRQWSRHPGEDAAAFFSRHVVPTVLGPKKRHYLIDHHHLVRAMQEEKVEEVMVSVEADLAASGTIRSGSSSTIAAGVIPMTPKVGAGTSTRSPNPSRR